MNSTTIEKILRSDKCSKHVFGGVYASDKLPETVDRYPSAYVANVDRSNMPGSHWIAFWFASPSHGEFFDSLGQRPETYTFSFVSFLARNSSKWTCNHRTVQSAFSNVCGHICIYYIFYRCRIMSMSTIICTIYNMSGRVVSDIQTRAEGESLYIRYNTDANVVNGLKNDSSYEFIGEVISKINVI